MKVVEEVRLGHLVRLIEAHESIAGLNRALGRPSRDATLSQILNGSPNSQTTKPRHMGSILAREIEKKLNKPIGWMDADPDAWPFENIERERFEVLQDFQKIEIQGAVRTLIDRFELNNNPKVAEFNAPKVVRHSHATHHKKTGTK